MKTTPRHRILVLLLSIVCLSLSITCIESRRSSSSRRSTSNRAPPTSRGGHGRRSSSAPGPRRSPAKRSAAYDEDYYTEEEDDDDSMDQDDDYDDFPDLGGGFGMDEDEYSDDVVDDESSLYDDEVLRPAMPSRRGAGANGGRRKQPHYPQQRGSSGKKSGSRSSGRSRGSPPASVMEQQRRQSNAKKQGGNGRNYNRNGGPPRSSRGRSGRYSSPQRQRDRYGRGRRSGAVVPYANTAASAFTRSIQSLKEHIPDPNTVKSSTMAAFSTVSEATNKYVREVKGMLSSELEQVLLKATRPDDSPVKAKHVERLIGVTYQISGQYDLYDPILRKLWSKMLEGDWRSTSKALYVLHRFSSDGADDHRIQLKARLRELRRTKDPKMKDGSRYFNTRLLVTAGKVNDEMKPFFAFMQRYAHYVLLRVQCFGGKFSEIAPSDALETDKGSSTTRSPRGNSRKAAQKKSHSSSKPITSTALRAEHLDAAKMLLKAGCACVLKDREGCELTASCAERIAIDMNGLTTAVAVALNRALKDPGEEDKQPDPVILKNWCEFYSDELLPQTKAMIKKTSATLDRYGIFLPSRMGASVSQELLEKGLKGIQEETDDGSLEESQDVEPQQDVSVDEQGDNESENTKKTLEVRDEEIEEDENVENEARDANENDEFDEEYDEYEYEYDEE